MKIKICGITNLDDALLCESLGVNAIGFILHKSSPRYVSIEKINSITRKLSAFTGRVGVFVNELPERINEICLKSGLNIVQLHGDETPDYIDKIKFPVIKAFRISHQFNFDVCNQFDCTILFDNSNKASYGGTGRKFNWETIPDKFKSKIILSGGINENNIEEIFESINPYAIDLSSSLESKPGIKDKNKVRAFINKFNLLKAVKC